MTVAIVVCGILKDEVANVVTDAGLDVPVIALAPAPCIDQDVLRRQLDASLRRATSLNGDALVVIGCCPPDIDEIVGRHAARRLDMRDCFEALLGRDERRRLDAEANTFYTLATWLPHWRRALSKGMRWDAVEARQAFARYERILLLDSGLHSIEDEHVLEFFDYVGVPVEIKPVRLDGLARLVLGALTPGVPLP